MRVHQKERRGVERSDLMAMRARMEETIKVV
jgi:hypothetical protein